MGDDPDDAEDEGLPGVKEGHPEDDSEAYSYWDEHGDAAGGSDRNGGDSKNGDGDSGVDPASGGGGRAGGAGMDAYGQALLAALLRESRPMPRGCPLLARDFGLDAVRLAEEQLQPLLRWPRSGAPAATRPGKGQVEQ